MDKKLNEALERYIDGGCMGDTCRDQREREAVQLAFQAGYQARRNHETKLFDVEVLIKNHMEALRVLLVEWESLREK